jgi:hypothetical protein
MIGAAHIGCIAAQRGSAPSSWRELFDFTSDGNSAGWGGYTVRAWITEPLLDGAPVGHLRFTFRAASDAGATIGSAYVQLQSEDGPYDPIRFATTPVQILFSGNPGVAISAGAEAVSDPVALSFDGSSPIVISFYCSAASSFASYPASGNFQFRYKAGDSASLVDPGGYSVYVDTFALGMVEAA